MWMQATEQSICATNSTIYNVMIRDSVWLDISGMDTTLCDSTWSEKVKPTPMKLLRRETCYKLVAP
jgi:hypothetical protein